LPRSDPIRTRYPHPRRARNTKKSPATAIRAAPPCSVAAGSKKPRRAAIAAATTAIDNIATTIIIIKFLVTITTIFKGINGMKPTYQIFQQTQKHKIFYGME
jgi:hypothetical protein